MGINMTQDEEHLRLLSIFHYIVGAISGLSALLPIFYLLFGLIFVYFPERISDRGAPPPALFGWLFIIFGAICTVVGLLLAGSIIATGRFLYNRKQYHFCLIIAGLQCAFFPFGTVLGVFTIIVLVRESVKQLFTTNP
jgi:hypothetical protein